MSDAKREVRELKKYLRALAVEVTNRTAELDGIMEAHESVDRGKMVARVANALNAAADSAMHFGLRMEFKEINKIKRDAARNAPQMPQRTFDVSSRFGTR